MIRHLLALALLLPCTLPAAQAIKDLTVTGTLSAGSGVLGQESINYHRPRRVVSRLYDYASTGTGRVRAVVFGDSLAWAKPRFALAHLNSLLGAESGNDGPQIAADSYSGAAGGTLSSSIVAGTFASDELDGYTYWPTGPLSQLTTSSRVQWTLGGVAPTFSKITVYYVKESGAGTFLVKVGGSTVATLDASAGSVALGSYEISQTRAQATVELAHSSGGNVRIITLVHSGTEGGVQAASVAVNGLALSSAMSSAQARTLFAAFLADWDPDLIFVEMDDTPATADLTSLATCFVSAATADKIITASTPSEADPTSTTRRDAWHTWVTAQDATWFLFDGWSPVAPHQTLVDLGWEGDGTHPAIACQAYLGGMMIEQMGWRGSPYGRATLPVNARWAASKLGRNTQIIGGGGTDYLAFETDSSFGYDWDVTFGRLIKFSTRGSYGTGAAPIAQFSGNTAVYPNVLPNGWSWGDSAATRTVDVSSGSGYATLRFLDSAKTNGGDELTVGNMHLLPYTTAQLQASVQSNTRAGTLVYVSDGSASGAGTLAYSIGEGPYTWRRVGDGLALGTAETVRIEADRFTVLGTDSYLGSQGSLSAIVKLRSTYATTGRTWAMSSAGSTGRFQLVDLGTNDGSAVATPITVQPTTGQVDLSGNLTVGAFIEGTEQGSSPAAPSANGWRIYAKDNGAGKTVLYVRFASGAEQQIAIEP